MHKCRFSVWTLKIKGIVTLNKCTAESSSGPSPQNSKVLAEPF